MVRHEAPTLLVAERATWRQLLTLGNAHEYPLDLQNIKPITARLKNQALMIHLEPAEMYTATDVLHIHLIPRVTAEH